MVDIHEVDESSTGKSSSSKTKNQNPSNINFGTSANQRKRRGLRTEQAKTEYADKVFGGGSKNAKEQTNYKSKSKPTGDETKFQLIFNSYKAFDIALTRYLAVCADPFSTWRFVCIILEWSGHGVPWFGFLFFLIFTLPKTQILPETQFILFNLLFGLLLDVMFVGTIKSIVQRPRPKWNHSKDMHGVVHADQFSFPSGHACRVVLMALLLLHMFPHLGAPTQFLIKSWAFWVCASRVMLGRHYFTDVFCGAILSYSIYYAMANWLFLSETVCGQIFNVLRSLK